MAAAYAALISLTHILHQILHPPPLNHILVIKEQIESLQKKVNFFIDFLENYSSRDSKEIEILETQIADAAYTAEDVIESNVIDQILARSAVDREKNSTSLCEGVQRVTEDFISIEKELTKIKDIKGVEDLPPKISTKEDSSSRPLPSGKNTMVGLNEHLHQIMSELTTDESNRLIIPIVGMGGIGKTTLASNVYNNPFIMEHFHIRAWVTVSQVYTKEEILLGIWRQVSGRKLTVEEKRDGKIGELLHKELFGRKYLIVMDDMWDIRPWEEVRWCLPANDNGSRILVTTRLSNLAVDFGSCSPHEMGFLDEKQSWDLLREKAFAKGGCPIELVGVGKSIARRCSGLPLALVVIGGLLAKSERTREHWESIERDVISAINHEHDEHFIKILSLSYSHLPIYLKPCFLYLAVFPEDFEIQVSRLVRLWVAEGFMKLAGAKSLEEVAEEYLEDLIDRNLILVGKRGSSGKVKSCRIHDLLRDMCMREAKKDKFLYVLELRNSNISPYVESDRHLSLHSGSWDNKVSEASRSAALIRSFLSYPNSISNFSGIARRLRLLRVFCMDGRVRYVKDEIPPLINLRYVACTKHSYQDLISSSVFQLWNIQTLVVDMFISLPAEIWQMPQIRLIKMKGISLCDPPASPNILVLENLHTLSSVEDFKCTEQVVKRIPNLKKLGIYYRTNEIGSFCLSNLVGFHKLESLVLEFTTGNFSNMAFPISLKKLALWRCLIPWEDMSIIGSLPNLEVLKLQYNAVKGQKWIPVEGEFGRLKFLFIDRCELEIWEADDTHFPSLEHLSLGDISLKEIPRGFAEILNLQVIQLRRRNISLWTSAEKISEERESLGYERLHIRSFSSSKKVVLRLQVASADKKIKQKAMKKAVSLSGVESIALDSEEGKLTVVGDIDPVHLVEKLRRVCYAEVVSVGTAKESVQPFL